MATKNDVDVLSQKIEVLSVSLEKLIETLSKERGIDVKRIRKQMDCLDMDYTPTSFSSVPIKTSSHALEDILYKSGQISRDNWEALRGIVYDVDDNFDENSVLNSHSEVDDEFSQSDYASYVNKPAPRVVETPKITSSENIVANSDVPASADSGDAVPTNNDK